MLVLSERWMIIAILVCFLQVIIFAEEHPEKDLVRVGEKVMTFEKGLPVLTTMLDGDMQQRMKGLDSLAYYGDTLLDTEAMKKITDMACSTNAFPITDTVLRQPLDQQNSYRKKQQASMVTAEAELFTVNLLALTIVVANGGDADGELLKRYLESASPTRRRIGESVSDMIKFYRDSGKMRTESGREAPMAESEFSTLESDTEGESD